MAKKQFLKALPDPVNMSPPLKWKSTWNSTYIPIFMLLSCGETIDALNSYAIYVHCIILHWVWARRVLSLDSNLWALILRVSLFHGKCQCFQKCFSRKGSIITNGISYNLVTILINLCLSYIDIYTALCNWSTFTYY